MIVQPMTGRNPGSTSENSLENSSESTLSAHPANPAARACSGTQRVAFAAVAGWIVAGLLVLTAATWAVRAAGRAGVAVNVSVDGYTATIRTARPDVAAVLADLGLRLRPEDCLAPPGHTPITSGLQISVERARSALIEVDGLLREVYAQAATAGEMIAAASVDLSANDEIHMDGALIPPEAGLPAVPRAESLPRYARSQPWESYHPPPVRISIRRAVPITVDDGTVPFTILTTADTVGEALLREQITLYLGDRVQPGPGTQVSAGLRVHIERSMPVLVTADGNTTYTRTRGKTVGSALMDLGIVLAGGDRVTPALDQALVDNLPIQVVRVARVTLVESTPIPYESIMVPDDNLEIDNQRLAQAGRDGDYRKRWQVTYEDGVETSRVLTDEWVAAEPVTRMVAYGRKIVLRTLGTEEGELTYWRKIRMYANSYSPARAGTSATAAWYGRTRIGLTLVKGIVAVDPRVIPLRTYVYVPNYGKAIAGDTGGGIKGKWIDMGYSDHDYISWHWWTDVYLLAPAPPARQILWVLPNYPPPGWPRNRQLGPAW